MENCGKFFPEVCIWGHHTLTDWVSAICGPCVLMLTTVVSLPVQWGVLWLVVSYFNTTIRALAPLPPSTTNIILILIHIYRYGMPPMD